MRSAAWRSTPSRSTWISKICSPYRMSSARRTVTGPSKRASRFLPSRSSVAKSFRRPAAEKVRGIEEPEHQVRVGHRRAGAAFAVARGTRLGAGALRADVENASRVDRRDRAAAGAERVDVDRRQRDLRDADRLFPGQL